MQVISTRECTDENMLKDNIKLAQLVVSAKQQLGAAVHQFNTALKEKDEEKMLKGVLAHHEALEKISKELKTKVKAIQAKHPKSNLFKRMIARVLDYCGSPALATKIAPNYIIERRLKSLSNAKFVNKVKNKKKNKQMRFNKPKKPKKTAMIKSAPVKPKKGPAPV